MRVKVLMPLLLLLTACGFKLRGYSERPTWLTSVAIISQESGQMQLISALNSQFASYGIPVKGASKAAYLLIIEKINTQQRLSSVSASTTPRQYQLIYAVSYKLLDTKDQSSGPTKTVSVQRQVTINNDRILGSSAEERLIAAEMHKEAAMQIINRLK